MAHLIIKRVSLVLFVAVLLGIFILPTYGSTIDTPSEVYLPLVKKPHSPSKIYLPLVKKPPPPPAWIGPYGGKIIAVAIAPTQPEIIYAGTWGSGVFKSSNGGVTWTWKNQGLSRPYINSMMVDPTNAQVVYAGTYKGKLYKSVDGAENWFLSSTNIQEEAIVYSIAINPDDPDTIYIGTRGISNNGNPPWNGELYKTTNGGANWTAVLTNLGGSSDQDWAYGIALHPENPSLLYAATHEHGVLRSTDSGRNWYLVNDGITNYSARGIVIDPHSSLNAPTVYMGAWKYDGVFKTLNGGDSWFFQNSSLGSRIITMSIDPVDSSNVYASLFPGGVLKTTNGGGNWAVTGLHDQEVIYTAINPVDTKLLYSGTNGNGLFRSLDRGNTWQLSQKGLHATQVSNMLVSLADSRLIAGVYGDGVRQSSDGGESWVQFGSNLFNEKILGIVENPANSNLLFAITESSGLYRCNLIVDCWLPVAINFPTTSQFQTAFDPDHPFAQTPFNEPWLSSTANDPLAVSENPALLSMVFAPSNPQIAFLGTSGAGLYKSTDAGINWQPSGLANEKIVSIAVRPNHADSIYAATPDNIFYSENGGVNWGNLNLSGVEIYSVALDSLSNLYAGTSDGIYRHSVGGWSFLGLQGIAATAVVSHPTETGWLYAGTTDGLYISHNAGQTWAHRPEQLSGLTIQSISFDPADPAIVYISTSTHGVMRIMDVD